MQHNAPLIVDDFLSPSELASELEFARGGAFDDWLGPDGQVYKRICRVSRGHIQHKIESAMGPVEMLGMAYRMNFGGEMPNAAIHSDVGWGTHAIVLYLQGGHTGTAFWRHKETGAAMIRGGDTALLARIEGDWDNAEAWEQTAIVHARPGRAVIYDSAAFHSRWPFAAAGEGAIDGRLVLVAFFTPLRLRQAVIRRAAHSDMTEILRMGERFYSETDYAETAPFCAKSCSKLVGQLVDSGILMVAEYRGNLAGMVGCYVAPFPFNRSKKSAHEVFWWVDEDWRGSRVGADLLHAVEVESAAEGASLIQMLTLSTSPPHAASAYKRAGYRHSETCFTKVLPGHTDVSGQG